MVDIVHKANQAITELRKVAERVDAKTSENEEKMQRINDEIDKLQSENQTIFLEKKAAEDRQKETEQKIADLEKAAYRPGAFSSGILTAQSQEVKAFLKACTKGDKGLSVEEMKYLRTDNDPSGGYLAPPEYVQEILKKITELTPIRQFARVRQTSRGSIEVPTRTELVNAFWVGEGGTINESQSKYGMQVIKVNKLGINTVLSVEMMQDSAFNMDAEIQSDAILGIALVEGETFVTGDGVEKPQGILNDSRIEITLNGNITDINFDALIDLRSNLKTGYNGVYFANRRTIGNMRKQPDGNGRYLIDFFTQSGVPPVIFGDPLIEAPAVPDIASGSFPVIYGDLGKGYNIVDGQQISVVRDDYTLVRQGKVQFVWFVRVGGQVVLPEAIKKLEMSVA